MNFINVEGMRFIFWLYELGKLHAFNLRGFRKEKKLNVLLKLYSFVPV